MNKYFVKLDVVLFYEYFVAEIEDVVILILNQRDDFNSKVALELGDSIYMQVGKLNKV